MHSSVQLRPCRLSGLLAACADCLQRYLMSKQDFSDNPLYMWAF